MLLLVPLLRYAFDEFLYTLNFLSQLSIIETIEASSSRCCSVLLLPSIRRGNRGLTTLDEYLVLLSRLARAIAMEHMRFADWII